MRAIPAMVVLALLCATQSGCSLFKKSTNPTGPANQGGPAPPKFPGANDPLLNSNIPTPPAFPPSNPTPAPAPTTQTSFGNSMLAGKVVDAYYRPVPNAYIRWVNLEEKDKGAPIDVAADGNGHFIIQGLKPGGAYKLIARTKQGEKLVAGTVLTTAPNTRLAIMIRDDLANSSNIPPLPTAPVAPTPAQGADTTLKPGNDEPNLPATMALPVPKNTQPVGNPPASTENPAWIPGIADVPKDRPPLLKMPNKTPPSDPPPLPKTPGTKLDTGPTRVPSCVLVGNHLENLALKDNKGQTWEYKKNGAGKLVLIDFWGTHCFYCRDSMPVLNRLHQTYGSRGLEVVGIAMEQGKDERREAEAVSKYATAMQLNYRQLMGRTSSLDVGKSFKVEGVPTLILLDEQGDIFIHQVGRPDSAFWSMLERTIQNRLNSRPL